MSHNFHINQDIVCIKTHSRGVVKEGEVYVVQGLRQGVCKCSTIDIHVGFFTDSDYEGCEECGMTIIATDNIFWVSHELFAPLDTLTDISEIEEVLSKPIFEL